MARVVATKKSKKKSKVVRILPAGQVAKAVARLGAPTGTDRFAAGKVLIATAEKDPGRVYPHFAAVARLLGSENKIVRWEVQRILGALARVDVENRIEPLLGEYLAYIRGTNMISAANAIGGAGEIAKAKPELRGRIVEAILGVETATYETPECRNVAIGHALEVLKGMWREVKEDAAVRGFVERQVGNTRVAAAKRARELMTR
jgi:hypothetical protein